MRHTEMHQTVVGKLEWRTRARGRIEDAGYIGEIHTPSCEGPSPVSASINGGTHKLTRKCRKNDEAARYIKQSVTLTGLGSDVFDEMVSGIYDVAEFMGRQVLDGELKDWVPAHVDAHVAVQAGNRYFQWKDSPNAGKAVEFQPFVDPRGVLARMGGENFIHTEDNTVSYTDCHVVDGGRNK